MIYDINEAKALVNSGLSKSQLKLINEINKSIELNSSCTIPWSSVLVRKPPKSWRLENGLVEIADKYYHAGYKVVIIKASRLYDIMVYWGSDVEWFRNNVDIWNEMREGEKIYEAY